MTTVYLSAPYSRMHELRVYREELRALGLTVGCSWLDGDGEAAAEINMTDAEAATVAKVDLDEVWQADILIAFSEAGAAPTTEACRGGRHVEFGYALAAKVMRLTRSLIEIWLVGPRENVFNALADERFDHWGELTAYVRGRSEGERFDLAEPDEVAR